MIGLVISSSSNQPTNQCKYIMIVTEMKSLERIFGDINFPTVGSAGSQNAISVSRRNSIALPWKLRRGRKLATTGSLAAKRSKNSKILGSNTRLRNGCYFIVHLICPNYPPPAPTILSWKWEPLREPKQMKSVYLAPPY